MSISPQHNIRGISSSLKARKAVCRWFLALGDEAARTMIQRIEDEDEDDLSNAAYLRTGVYQPSVV